MFSVGIFTTHIPYIAFVVFYAWILIFGVEKASNGELQSSEKKFVTEFNVEKINSSYGSAFHYNQADFEHVTNFLVAHFKPKIKHKSRVFALFHHCECVSSLSNRPPPVFS